MAECIDRERALAIVAMSTSKAEAEKGLRDLSAENVVLVERCRDCKYDASCFRRLNPYYGRRDDDYCSYGEREDGSIC